MLPQSVASEYVKNLQGAAPSTSTTASQPAIRMYGYTDGQTDVFYTTCCKFYFNTKCTKF